MTTGAQNGGQQSRQAGEAGLGPVGVVIGLLKGWRARRARDRELESLDPLERHHIAEDLGVTDAMLAALVHRDQGSELLSRRAAELGLTHDDIERLGHGVWRQLQVTCSQCMVTGACGKDLDERPQSDAWTAYCPNAATLQSAQPADRARRDAAPEPELAPGNSDLFLRRLAALGLTTADLDRVCSLLQADAAEACGTCRDKKVCRDDLAADPEDPRWRDYCLNSGSLESVRALKGRGRI